MFSPRCEWVLSVWGAYSALVYRWMKGYALALPFCLGMVVLALQRWLLSPLPLNHLLLLHCCPQMRDLCPLGADEQLIPVQRSWLWVGVFALSARRTKHVGKNGEKTFLRPLAVKNAQTCAVDKKKNPQKNNWSSSTWFNTSSICFQKQATVVKT